MGHRGSNGRQQGRLDEYHGWVTIRDDAGESWGRAQASLRGDGRLLVGEITAPLWMVSLAGGVAVRFDQGSAGTLRVREIRGMDGPVATVHVEVEIAAEVDADDGASGVAERRDHDHVDEDLVPDGVTGVGK